MPNVERGTKSSKEGLVMEPAFLRSLDKYEQEELRSWGLQFPNLKVKKREDSGVTTGHNTASIQRKTTISTQAVGAPELTGTLMVKVLIKKKDPLDENPGCMPIASTLSFDYSL